MPVKTEFACSLVRLAEVGPQWARLHAEAGGGPFSSADWLAAWASAYGNLRASPFVALAWSGDRLVAGIPLGLQRSHISTRGPRVARLGMLCDERAGFHEVLGLPGPDGQTGVAALLDECLSHKGWELVDLNPVQASEALEALTAHAETRGLVAWRRDEVRRAVCNLAEGWPAYLDRRSGNFRKSIRAARKKVEAAGGTLRIIRGGEADAEQVLHGALALSARCWKAQMDTDIGSNPRVRAFMADIWARFSARGAARILLLTIDGREAASCFLLRAGDREFGFITDFDEDFAALSPGRYIVSHALETAAADGVSVFDMMRLTPFWERFADEILAYERIRLCRRFGLPWLWLSAEEHARPMLRELHKSYRQRHRKRIAFKDKAREKERIDGDA